jgi:hypothetical protein
LAVEVVPATAEHGLAVAAAMRPADIAEVWAVAHHSPMQAVELSLAAPGEQLAFLISDMPLAVFGCSRLSLDGIGSPWLLGAVGVERYSRQFLELGRTYVTRWATEYEGLINVVDQRNDRSIRWLGKLGFSFHEPVLVGPDAMPFLPFEMRRTSAPGFSTEGDIHPKTARGMSSARFQSTSGAARAGRLLLASTEAAR